jgi:endonuclease G
MADLSEKKRLLAAFLGDVAPRFREEGPASGLESISPEHADKARTGLDKVFSDAGELTPDEAWTLEAIVLPKERPVFDIRQDTYQAAAGVWEHLNDAAPKARLERVIPAVGRVELPGNPTKPYSGTGFIVGPNLLMTNRHVAADFSSGVGSQELRFLPGQPSAMDFVQEREPRPGIVVEVKQVVMVHPFWDMALLRVDGLPPGRAPLGLVVAPPPDGDDIAVIGYPAFSPYNDAKLQAEIFGGVFNVKRLQPGKLKGIQATKSFGKTVDAVGHDASTLGGNSGSAVIHTATGNVVALHFAGNYLKMNYAVPAWELARDSRIVDAGVNFVGPAPGGDPWAAWWTSPESLPPPVAPPGPALAPPRPVEPPRPVAPPAPATGGGVVELTIPLHITVRLGEPVAAAAVAPRPATETVAAAEAPAKLRVEPSPDYERRRGYDPLFLGGGARVDLPVLPLDHRDDVSANGWDADPQTRHLLPYHHFSVCLRKSRRLAWFVAVNVDGRREVPMQRNWFDRDTWHYDPRLPRTDQVGNEFYGTPYDRGHLVRRLDPVWGAGFEEGKAANDDTFHWTNCSPQHKDFNREDSLWAGIEDYVLKNAQLRDLAVTVITGPVFRAADPVVEKVRVPLEFWKVVAMVRSDGKLAATAYLLSQADLVAAAEEGFVFGAWRSFQVPIATIAARTGLSFGTLAAVDVLDAGQESTTGGARRLAAWSDMQL